jgi:2-polyprenyl-3-methyl-5-hydroxy-6-metoxy-1,4-benzoquinol methylase
MEAVVETQSTGLSPDPERVQAVLERAVGHLTGSAVVATMILGDQLGLYRALAGAGFMSASELAHRTQCQPRLVREWLDANTAAGFLEYRAENETYRLSDDAAMVLAVEDSPAFVAGGGGVLRAGYIDIDKIAAAFRGNGAFAWSDHHECLFSGTGRFFRPGYLNFLTTAWLPSLTGVVDKLKAGASIADIGCGVGYSTELMARAFPKSRVSGFDYHRASVEAAEKRAGQLETLSFAVADAQSYEGRYDLICFFDCLHDLGDPVGAARYALEHLAEDGTVMLVEPFARDDRAENHHNPVAALLYSASTFLCTPNSLSQPVGRALGAQSGETRMRAVFQEAGYNRFRRATETPFNIVYEAKQ